MLSPRLATYTILVDGFTDTAEVFYANKIIETPSISSLAKIFTYVGYNLHVKDLNMRYTGAGPTRHNNTSKKGF